MKNERKRIKTRIGKKVWLPVALLAFVFWVSIPVNAAGTEEKEAAESSEEVQAASVDLEDGAYTVEVELEGGSGRASISSPAALTVKDQKAYARIVWDSSNYDYMLVGGQKYLPLEGEETSVFEIPVPAFDEAVTVIGDTTAMSVPYEVEYRLTFDLDSVSEEKKSPYQDPLFWIGAAVVVYAAGRVLWENNKRGKGASK